MVHNEIETERRKRRGEENPHAQMCKPCRSWEHRSVVPVYISQSQFMCIFNNNHTKIYTKQ